jgi:hypothetical protein
MVLPGASGYARLRPRESAPKGARRFPAQTSVFDLKISDRFVEFASQNRDRRSIVSLTSSQQIVLSMATNVIHITHTLPTEFQHGNMEKHRPMNC